MPHPPMLLPMLLYKGNKLVNYWFEFGNNGMRQQNRQPGSKHEYSNASTGYIRASID